MSAATRLAALLSEIEARAAKATPVIAAEYPAVASRAIREDCRESNHADIDARLYLDGERLLREDLPRLTRIVRALMTMLIGNDSVIDGNPSGAVMMFGVATAALERELGEEPPRIVPVGPMEGGV